MRLNKFLSTVTPLSRRKADEVIERGLVLLNGTKAGLGTNVFEGDRITYQGKDYVFSVDQTVKPIVVLLNKPVGYVCSHDGQGAPTVYDLLPQDMQSLKIAGRLDKDSSGLVVLTSSGDLLNRLTHPSFKKQKTYLVSLNRNLSQNDLDKITKTGVRIGDPRSSRFKLIQQPDKSAKDWIATLEEGRNRQIRRTFEAVGYDVLSLKRIALGSHILGDIKEKHHRIEQAE